MSSSRYQQNRPSIPAEIREEIKREAGHACAIPRCHEHTYADIHHINKDREDNRKENLIFLCALHHRMAHANEITEKEMRAYKVLLQDPHVANQFVRGTEADRVNRFLTLVNNTLSYRDFDEISSAGSETGYQFEIEVHQNLIQFKASRNYYNSELRSHDPNAQGRQDQIVSLLDEILQIRETGNYQENSLSAKYLPSSKPGTSAYDQEINDQRDKISNRLLRIRTLCQELSEYGGFRH